MNDLPEGLEKLWQEAEAGKPVEVGRYVVCDGCSKEFTDSNEKGGFIFGNYAYGPCCAQRMLSNIASHREEKFLRAVCPEYSSFADFVRKYREDVGGTTISITKVGG